MAPNDEILKNLKTQRGQIKSQVTRFSTYLDTTFPISKNITQLAKRLEKIELLWDEFGNCQLDIERLDDSSQEQRDRESFENAYFEIVTRAQEMIDEHKQNRSIVSDSSVVAAGGSGSSNNKSEQVKLPLLNLPEFSGSSSEYMHFRDTFESLINKNDTLSKVQKFHYLISCLQGDALKVVQSLDITDNNYAIAWNLLKETYDNKRAIINSHLESLCGLPTLHKESSAQLRNFLNSYLKDIRSLKNLGEPVDTWDSILLFLLTSKLDFATKLEWESSIRTEKLPTQEDFSKFLNFRCQLLENLYRRSAISSNDSCHSKKGSSHIQRGLAIKSFNHVSMEKMLKCYFCQGGHCMYYCTDFLKLTGQERFNAVKRLNLCKNCLKPKSQGHKCTGFCKICKGKGHNTLLHIDNSSNNSTTSNFPIQGQNSQRNSRGNSLHGSESQNIVGNTNNVSISTHCSNSENLLIILSTANIFIEDNDKNLIQCRCLLDGGSQSNFITRDLAKRLNLKIDNINLPIMGIGESMTSISHRVHTNIKSMHNSYSRKQSFLILENITGNIPYQSFDTTLLSIPEGIVLADKDFNESKRIDVLLGASIFYELLTIGQINLGKNLPLLQNSKLGWLVAGPLQLNLIRNSSQTCLLSIHTSQIQSQLEKFWVIEDVQHSASIKYSKDQQFCEDHFIQNYKRDTTGRFTVSLPLKENYKDIGNTFELAMKRFISLERKLKGNQTFADLYTNFIREYESLGHMTKLTDEEIKTNDTTYYLPHHGVLKESSVTTKLRVVFDGSAKSSTGISLNDVSYVGPTIQDDIFSILLRFRKHNYVIQGDITKMYRQVNVNPEQRNLQRILWRDSPDQELSHYALNTVTYGTAPAAFLSIRSLHQVAIDNKNNFPKASNTILSDFYVDDLITGDNSIIGLGMLKSEISEILQSAGFILTQWMSNSTEILDSDEQQTKFHFSDDKTVKTLGIAWNPNSDTFQFSVNIRINSQNLTKRIILSIISQVFDPLGIIGPVITKAKVILQHLWKLKVGWDEPIPPVYNSEFLQFFQDLKYIDRITVPRHVLLSTYIRIQLHGFTDASQVAYGVCIYLRSTDSFNKHSTQLLCSKSRVAPLKVISIPRLELCGALLLSRLVDKCLRVIKLNIAETFLWTDSTIVLAWLAQESVRWKTFVSNRVSEIQDLTNNARWCHVCTSDNPADLISRGCNPNQLLESDIWWTGPDWLQRDIQFWPKPVNQSDIIIQDIPEQRIVQNIVLLSTDGSFDLFNKFSRFQRLRNVTAWCIRFLNNLKLSKQGKQRFSGNLTTGETEQAVNVLVKLVQKSEFSKELVCLRNSKVVPRKSKILSLNPFLDNNAIIRVGGRLVMSNLNYNQKFPILLPSKHIFTKLIINYEHERTLHGGVQTILSTVRGNFWPINAKNVIKGVIRECMVCFKVKPVGVTPIMGQLPASRVNPARPFLTCGIDLAGPFTIKEGTLRNRKLVKVYVCVFICFAVKAIHLELAGDLSAPVFLNALKRFFARRGISREIWTDNGLNFVGASNQIQNSYDTLFKINQDPSVKNYLLDNKVTWHFIPPRAPHFGGLWESAVKLTKHHLTRTIGIAYFTYENFHTILTQIESILNSRPLCPISNDPNDLAPLTPGHFLIGSALNALPEENVEDISLNRLSKYQQVQHVVQSFWRRWTNEYLHNLQQRNKWMTNDPNILKSGLMVVLREDNVHPLNWKMGRIIEVYRGKDDIARVASVKTSSGVVKRSFSKLCILPIDT